MGSSCNMPCLEEGMLYATLTNIPYAAALAGVMTEDAAHTEKCKLIHPKHHVA